MNRMSSHCLFVRLGLLLVLYLWVSNCVPYRNIVDSNLLSTNHDTLSPAVSPTMDTQPLLPLLAPSQVFPFTNNTVPRLSGLCRLNFSAAESILATTATNCWSSLAPYLANAVCCPQFHATSAILIGQYSKYSKNLGLNTTHAKHCLSDIEHILEGQGANGNLEKICRIYPSNLTGAACPVTDVSTFESIVDGSRLLSLCEKIDPLTECCKKVCQNAIKDAAEQLALKNNTNVGLTELATVNDCRSIVIRWVASKLDIASANHVLRGLSSCNVNKVCPLVFPNTSNVSRECGKTSDRTLCCEAMEKYMTNLQEQSFVTNVQALHCASLLGKKLQRANISIDIYSFCRINLKDFSLQVESQETGCLLPSLPSDVTYDQSNGISFSCDLNDNVLAPWPSSPPHTPPCIKTAAAELPGLPKAESAQAGLLHAKRVINSVIFSCVVIVNFILI